MASEFEKLVLEKQALQKKIDELIASNPSGPRTVFVGLNRRVMNEYPVGITRLESFSKTIILEDFADSTSETIGTVKTDSDYPFIMEGVRFSQVRETNEPVNVFLPNAGMIDLGGTIVAGASFLFEIKEGTSHSFMDKVPSSELQGPLFTDYKLPVEHEVPGNTELSIRVTPLKADGGVIHNLYVTFYGYKVMNGCINKSLKQKYKKKIFDARVS